jgi:hypothetical protein
MTVIMAIKAQTGLNTYNINGTVYKADVADPYYGQDINIMYDPNGANPNQKYTVALGGHTPLTSQEMSYLNEIYDWEKLIVYPAADEVKQALQINGYYQLLNGGGQAQTTSVADQVLAGVPQPPAYQMASISPGVQMAPVPQPAGLTAPAPVFAPAPQPAPTFAPPQPQFAPPAQPRPQPVPQAQPLPQAQPAAVPYQQPVAPAPAPTYYPPQTPQPMPQAAPAAPLPQITPGFQQTAAPVIHQPAPTPVAQAPQPVQPVAQLQAQPVQAAVAPSNVVSINDGAPVAVERRFAFPSKPNGLSVSELQGVINDFPQTLPRATPLKTWDREDLNGMQVLNCFGSYKGDPSCIRCPIRRYCLNY